MQFTKFHDDLHYLNQIQIPRWVSQHDTVEYQLHGFADASQKAYGACLYVVSRNRQGELISQLLTAKTKVAPLKPTTIPRLELCAALMLARLVDKVRGQASITFQQYHLWSDSQVVLAWLKSNPAKLKTFVSNRVQETQDLTGDMEWKYVPSQENPADLLSRGAPPSELAKAELWWHGPKWLTQGCDQWPMQKVQKNDKIPELKNDDIQRTLLTQPPSAIITRQSSWRRLARVTAYCRRFLHNARKGKNRHIGALSLKEIVDARTAIIRLAQQEMYAPELKILATGNQVSKQSHLSSLSPFIDSEGVLRVGGRLQLASMNYDEMHPVILDGKHHLTTLIVRDAHLQTMHAGVNTTLAFIREKYWIVRGKDSIKRVVRQCLKCFRANPRRSQPQMGILPRDRVTQGHPFQSVGLDYAGPFQIKSRSGRGAKVEKCYLALFICLAVKAVHLEIVSNLSTEALIAALRRFVARRGKPQSILSDNGTNMVGADRELRRLLESALHQDKMQHEASEHGIEWRFNPPRTPHFGGIWENAVKSAKFHLKRVVNNTPLTFEELYTLSCQIEAILNSRPLTPLSNDPRDLNPLTPAHFLIHRKLTAVAEPHLLDIRPTRLSSYQHLQQMVQGFWRRWSHEYLQQLNQRSKWQSSGPNQITVGSMVLLEVDNLPSLQWPTGRVRSIHKGPDGVIRVATVETAQGIYKRGVTRLYPLPPEEVAVETPEFQRAGHGGVCV